MKVLVIEDNPVHRSAARTQLKDHEVTVIATYDAAQDLVDKRHEFEVVLVDLLMPASCQQMSMGNSLVGQEMPVGIFLALLAAKNGAKYVAVFTDSDHHSHPASACFDAFNEHERRPTPFTVENAKVLLSNTRDWIDTFYENDLSKVKPWDKEDNAPEVRAKNWQFLLDYLFAC